MTDVRFAANRPGTQVRVSAQRSVRRWAAAALVPLLAYATAACGVDPPASARPDVVPQVLPQSPAEASAARARLSSVVLGAESVAAARLPEAEPTVAPSATLPPTVRAATFAATGLDLPQRFGLVSHALVLTPKKTASSPCALIWHDGHGSTPLEAGGDAVVAEALAAGCTTVVMAMPLRGFNLGQVATLPDGTQIRLGDAEPRALHNSLRRLDVPGRSALDLFVAPVVQVVSYLTSQNPTTQVMMAGLSGGGWTTSVSAAVDPRISQSLAVAGSAPVRSITNCHYDYEQCHPDLLSQVSLEQIYALGAIGEPGTGERTAADVLNLYDSCCYFGVEGRDFVPAVQASVAASGGGRFIFVADTTLQTHAVPGQAVAVLRRWLPATAATTAQGSG